MNVERLITECALVNADYDKVVWGDLHRLGDTYIFSAVLSGREANWQHPIPPMLDSTPTVTLTTQEGLFERRGVIIFPKEAAELNTAAFRRASRS